MESFDRYLHWENIYKSKKIDEVSWFQAVPGLSLHFIKQAQLPFHSKIIDIGGGDSFFADCLLDLGYHNITVLDISETALKKAQKRLGEKAETVKWIVADATDFQLTEKYDFWHDRTAFHFLTDKSEIEKYVQTTGLGINKSGTLVIGTFSEIGPKKCSGIEIKQYSESNMARLFEQNFEKLDCITSDHITPSNSVQNFIFCSFKRK